MKKTFNLFVATMATLYCLDSNAMSYEKYVQSYPLPHIQKKNCNNYSESFWVKKAKKLISTKKLLKSSTKGKNIKLEDHIQKNALITLAYARLAKINEHKEFYPIWLFAGANASYIVGQSLKLNYKYANKLPIPENQKLDFVTAQAFKSRMLGNQVAKGNQGVYLDIYWKFLSAQLCGVANTVRILKESQTDYNHEIKIWEGFIADQSDFNDRSLKLALEYVDVEQSLLQKIMYDSIASRISNALKVFNHFAVLELQMPDAPVFSSFDEYVTTTPGLRDNLAHYHSRVHWMKSLLRELMPYAVSLYWNRGSERAFELLEELNLEVLN